jgi:transposase
MGKGDTIVLGGREQRRVQVLNRVLGGGWHLAEAAQALGRSERQVRRLLAAYAARGPAALVHGNRGRVPANRWPAAVRQRVLKLAQTTYAGCNDVHLAELLAEREGIAVGRATVQRWRRGAERAGQTGVGSPRSRRAPRHRQRRERAAREGLLLQADGSPHKWLGPDGPEWTLIAGIDDATGTIPWDPVGALPRAGGRRRLHGLASPRRGDPGRARRGVR